ncbi:GNAT family N-acetyltransferase [Candidatus Thorarchaeota archaeon]|nr:MAG: GNAT family N-acetyltransferase [Candidatus Thorarchaeota archaeon]
MGACCTTKFQIRRFENDDDWDFFFKLGYETAKVLRKFVLDPFVKDNPDASDEEIASLFRKETEEYFDFELPDARVFIAETEEKERFGYLWMGMRNSKDAWDTENQQWIYDIVVDPKFYGNGIGRLLLEKAEEFSTELNRNLGLFVHADNSPAIALYKKSDYVVKQVPVSRLFPYDSEDTPLGDNFIVREMKDDEYDAIIEAEFDQFKKKVEFSVDVDINVKKKLHQEHQEIYFKDREKHQRLVALTKDDEIVGTIWVGSAGFDNKLIARFHEITINVKNQSDKIGDYLVNSAEKWAQKNKFSSVYILLHSTDPLDVDFFKERGYKVPGFFMEKRLKK